MLQTWEIKGRSPHCTVTGRPFADGEPFYTLLFLEKDGYRREDLCEEAWQQRDATQAPFSFWRSTFEADPPPPPSPLSPKAVEPLLRHYLQEPGPEHAAIRFFLALLLERKRVFKPMETRDEEGRTLHVYLHAHTGEVFIIPDPNLRLDELERIQQEVALQLAYE